MINGYFSYIMQICSQSDLFKKWYDTQNWDFNIHTKFNRNPEFNSL